MNTVDAECSDCKGTGLYHGMAEPKDTAVVCQRCAGSGCKKIEYAPFSGRKRMQTPGLKYVTHSRGRNLVQGMGPTGNRITLDEFYGGRMP